MLGYILVIGIIIYILWITKVCVPIDSARVVCTIDPRETVLTKDQIMRKFREYVEKLVEKIPSITPLSESEFRLFLENPFTNGDQVLLFLSSPTCVHCKQLSPIVGLSAQQMNIPLLYVEDKVLKQVLKGSEFEQSPFKVKGYPVVFLYKNNENTPILVQKGSGPTVDEFIQIVNKVRSNGSSEISLSSPGNLQRRRPVNGNRNSSRDSPSDSNALLSGTGDFSSDYVLMLWAPWCGACTAIKPKYLEAIEKMKSDPKFNHIPMFLMEAERNNQFMRNNNLNAIPAILKMSGNRIMDQFMQTSGMPTAESIIDWIKIN